MSYPKRFAAIAAFSFLALPVFADGIEVIDPYARAASASAKSGAAFMTLRNTSGQDDRLIAARTDAAKRVELHTHAETGDGIMQMMQIEGGIPVASGAMHQMVRGGDHIMLMGLTGPLEQGAEITVTLEFEAAGEMRVTIPVDNERAPEAGAHGAAKN